MKQVLRKGLREIIVAEVPEPALRPQHVLIRPHYSLISSGTEMASIHMDGVVKEVAGNPSHLKKVWDAMKAAGPRRTLAETLAKFSEYAQLGYSGAGVIIEKDPGIRELEVGDRVAYGGETTGHCETVLAGRNLVVKLPNPVPFNAGCFTTLGSIAANAVRVAGLSLGETVAVIGLGLVGQLVAQLARLQGGIVIGIDLKPARADLARSLGADYAVTGGAAAAQTSAITDGRGVDAAIVAAAAKSAAPVELALDICRDRGRIVIVGAVDVAVPWDAAYRKEISVLMSRAYGPGSYDSEYEEKGRDYPLPYVRWTERRNMEEFARLLGAGKVDVSRLVTHEFALEDAPQAYGVLFDPAAQSLAVLLRYPAAELLEDVPPRRTVHLRAPEPRSGLGVMLAGAGNIARWYHLPNVRKARGAHVRAIYSESGVRGRGYGERFGAAYCTSDYESALADPGVDVVLITSRNERHAREALLALRAGKHVFVEKPMCLTEDDCRALVTAVRETGRQLTVGFNRRFAPFYLRVKEALARRAGPAILNCRVSSPGISGAYWMADPATGGAILGEACHFVDLMYWLLSSEPLEVAAFSLPAGRAEPIGENNIAASFRFADGSVGNLTYCTLGTKASAGERVEVFAPGIGAWTQDFKAVNAGSGLLKRRTRLWADKGYAGQMKRFLEGLRKGRPPEVTVIDGARATIGCLRMMEAARTGAVVKIDLESATERAAA